MRELLFGICFLLFVVACGALVICLIKPSILKREFTRRQILIIFSSLALGLFILSLVTVPPTNKTEQGQEAVVSNPTSLEQQKQEPTPIVDVNVDPIQFPSPSPTLIPTIVPTSTPRPTNPPKTQINFYSTPQVLQGSYVCNCSKTCGEMSCSEAQYQLNVCGCTRRDADHDGVACDSQCQ